jgi:hypothetical protein
MMEGRRRVDGRSALLACLLDRPDEPRLIGRGEGIRQAFAQLP